jgi:ribosomal-protein-serine acetyltransferase
MKQKSGCHQKETEQMKTIQVRHDLVLRQLEEKDAAAMFALTDQNRDYLRQWLPWLDSVRSADDSLYFIRNTMEQANRNQGMHYGIWYQDKLAGTIGNHRIDWINRRTWIGYWLSADCQGKGIMTASVRAYLDELVFGKWDLHRAEIAAATENRKSRAIPERLGFQLEGIIRENEWLYDHYVDHAVYGMLAREWKKGR